MTYLFTTLTVALAILTWSCTQGKIKSDTTSQPDNTQASTQDWVIKTYETKPEAGRPSVKALQRLLAAKAVKSHLHKGDEGYSKIAYVVPSQGRAWLAGSGLVALNAHPDIHKGVPELIERIASSKVKQKHMVATEIWSLLAVKSDVENKLLPNLEEALAKLRQERPGLCVVEADHLYIPSAEGHEFHGNSHSLKVKGYTVRAEQYMLANLELKGANPLQSMVKGKPGETFVILEGKINPQKTRAHALKDCGVNADNEVSIYAILAIKLTNKG